MGKLNFFINFINHYKITKPNGGILLRNLFLTKTAQWKTGPSLILKKLNFFIEIHSAVTPSIMEIDKILTEMFLFLTSKSTQ